MFHVCYSGWQRNWNEWTSRSRLRWHSQIAEIDCTPGHDSYSSDITLQSTVELKVVGRSCNAWLECKVSDIIKAVDDPVDPTKSTPELYMIKDAKVNDLITVPRSMLRLAPLPSKKSQCDPLVLTVSSET